MSYVLEGFDTMHGNKLDELDNGEFHAEDMKSPNPEAPFEASKTVPIKVQGVGAVRLSMTLWDTSGQMASTGSLPLLHQDSRAFKIAQDAIWIED